MVIFVGESFQGNAQPDCGTFCNSENLVRHKVRIDVTKEENQILNKFPTRFITIQCSHLTDSWLDDADEIIGQGITTFSVGRCTEERVPQKFLQKKVGSILLWRKGANSKGGKWGDAPF
jgi:hypothetical protein